MWMWVIFCLALSTSQLVHSELTGREIENQTMTWMNHHELVERIDKAIPGHLDWIKKQAKSENPDDIVENELDQLLSTSAKIEGVAEGSDSTGQVLDEMATTPELFREWLTQLNNVTELEKDKEVSSDSNSTRSTRALLGPAMIAAIPQISEFMGSLIRPIISSVANRAGQSSHRDTILQTFVRRVFAGTELGQTQLQGALTHQLKQREYQIALNTLKAREQGLNQSYFLPNPSTDKSPSARDTLAQFTEKIDTLFQLRLKSLSQVSASFISSLIQAMRVKLQQENSEIKTAMSQVKDELTLILSSLENQIHEPELYKVYVMLVAILMIALCLGIGMVWLRHSVINFLIRHQIRFSYLRNPNVVDNELRQMQASEAFLGPNEQAA